MIRRRSLCAALAAGALPGCRRERRDGEVAFWFSYGGNNRKVLLELCARFNREQSAVRVRPVFQGDYFEGLTKLRTGLFVGQGPTVTHVVGEVLPYLAQAGVLEPLDDVGQALIADLEPALSQAGGFAGAPSESYGLPFNRSTPIAFTNRDLLARLGVQAPRSWDELRQAARSSTAFANGVTSRFGFCCPIDWWFWAALVGQAGGQLFERGTLTLGGQAGARAIELWQAMLLDDRTMRAPPGRDFSAWEAAHGDLLAGRAAMIWSSTAFVRYLQDTAPFVVGAAPLPAGVRRAVPTGGTFFIMPRGLPRREREAGLSFLRWMMQPEQVAEWSQKTGYLPVSRAGRGLLERSGWFARHPNYKVAIEELADVQAWAWAPELFRIQREIVQPRLEAAVRARLPAAGVIAEAVASARE